MAQAKGGKPYNAAQREAAFWQKVKIGDPNSALARALGVDRATIRNIRNRVSYREV